MDDLDAARLILAREAGYPRTAIACKHLDISPGQLLSLRRRMLESALGRPLPPLGPGSTAVPPAGD